MIIIRTGQKKHNYLLIIRYPFPDQIHLGL